MAKDDVKFMVDKRTSRKENAADFQAGIAEFRRHVPEEPSQGPSPPSSQGPFRVYVRKRPLFQHETANGEYDTVTCAPGGLVVVHKCTMRPDLRRMFIAHRVHEFTGAFGETADNKAVYLQAVRPLVAAVLEGRPATLLMYGQTGSGKTHTMQGVTQYAAMELFGRLPAGAHVTLSSLELQGRAVVDLLNDRAPLTLREDADGRLTLAGLVAAPAASPEALLRGIERAGAERRSQATHINANSSRSHLFTRITVARRGAPPAVLTLVDLAGSERNEDSKWHDADRRKESAQINASLAVLKQCLRLQGAGTAAHVPYRQTELTRLLKDTFTCPEARATLIATVSPPGTDSEHTLDTLAHAAAMASTEGRLRTVEQDVPIGLASKGRGGTARRVIPPGQWTAAEVQEWLQHLSGGRAKLPAGVDGKQLVRMAEVRFIQACDGDAKLGYRLFEALQGQIHAVNESRVQSAKASRLAQIEHKHEQAVQSAGLRYAKAPVNPTVQRSVLAM